MCPCVWSIVLGTRQCVMCCGETDAETERKEDDEEKKKEEKKSRLSSVPYMIVVRDIVPLWPNIPLTVDSFLCHSSLSSRLSLVVFQKQQDDKMLLCRSGYTLANIHFLIRKRDRRLTSFCFYSSNRFLFAP